MADLKVLLLRVVSGVDMNTLGAFEITYVSLVC